MFSGGQTNKVKPGQQPQLTDKDLQDLQAYMQYQEGMRQLEEELAKKNPCEWKEPADGQAGMSCEYKPDQYEGEDKENFRKYLKDEGFNCHILPNGNWACFNPAEGVAEKSAETEEPSGLARVWEATRNVIKAAPLLGELWDAELEFGMVVLDVLFGDDEEEAEEAGDPNKAPIDEIGSKKAKESDKPKKADQAEEAGKTKDKDQKEPVFKGSIVVDLGPDGKTVANDLRNDIEAHFPNKEDEWDGMEKYATKKAKEYGGAKQRVIWEPETFWEMYMRDKMEKGGVTLPPDMTTPDVVAEVYDFSDPKKDEDGKSVPNFTIDGSGKKKAFGSSQGSGKGKVGGAGKGGNGKKSDKGKAPITR